MTGVPPACSWSAATLSAIASRSISAHAESPAVSVGADPSGASSIGPVIGGGVYDPTAPALGRAARAARSFAHSEPVRSHRIR